MDGRLALALACLLVAGCGSGIPPPPGTGIQGMVTLGPTCPVERDPPEPGCEDRPYAAQLVVETAGDDPDVVASFRSNEHGEYQVHVAPGTYVIRSDPHAGGASPRCSSDGDVTVTTGRYSTEAVSCDSGIR